MEAWANALLAYFAIPRHGLISLFLIAFLSATLLPMGSEPALFGLVKINADLLWPAIFVATLGNTLGGALDWWMGYGVHQWVDRQKKSQARLLALRWFEKHGAKACLLSWLPVVGDPLCAVAGWLRLPFWPCLMYMAIGKFLRYWLLTWTLLKIF